MNGNRWQMGGYDFALAVEAMGRDRLPYPLRVKPPRMEYREDFDRYHQQSAQRLLGTHDERFYRVMTVLLEPEVRVEIQGLFGAGQAQVARLYAGIAGERAAIALQKPGPTKDYGGEIIVTEHRANDVAAQLAARLPTHPAGTRRGFQGYREDIDAPVFSRHPTQLTPQEQLQRFFRRPRCGTGEITVYPGFTLDARPTGDGLAFLWLDYPDDGRYLLQHRRETFTVAPGSPEEITRQIQGRIAHLTERARATSW